MRPKIVVPMTKRDLEELNIYDYISDDNKQINQELTIVEYDVLYEAGVWLNINQIAGTLLDTYEEDEITDINKIIEVRIWLESYVKTIQDPQVVMSIEKLISLFYEAENRKTGLIFIL